MDGEFLPLTCFNKDINIDRHEFLKCFKHDTHRNIHEVNIQKTVFKLSKTDSQFHKMEWSLAKRAQPMQWVILD